MQSDKYLVDIESTQYLRDVDHLEAEVCVKWNSIFICLLTKVIQHAAGRPLPGILAGRYRSNHPLLTEEQKVPLDDEEVEPTQVLQRKFAPSDYVSLDQIVCFTLEYVNS